ncbi:MAG: aminoglycoside 6-adenylyltransferase [Clostridiaceae bacterium]|nr:aminoglycoside 6-adenylyltransferase [Clostridiaceae bacterium]
MGRFDGIIKGIERLASESQDVHAAIIIGSQAREDHPSDDSSDLDVILIVGDTAHYLKDDRWLENIGGLQISFLEKTIGGATERRILFEGALDVDFIIMTEEDLKSLFSRKALNGIFGRGYKILVDKIGLEGLNEAPLQAKANKLSEQEFLNLVNDFFYHTVWTAKKLKRGEMWTAKLCLDSYMKFLLLQMIECHALALHGEDYDIWHSGRFIEEWAESWIIKELSVCFAHFEESDIKEALFNTMSLFRAVAKEAAQMMAYTYPNKADEFASAWVSDYLEKRL